jgi:hypothetical protein
VTRAGGGALLDKGWGKAPQPHTGEDDKNICITIRQIIKLTSNSTC